MQLGVRELVPLVQEVHRFLPIPCNMYLTRDVVFLQDVLRETKMLVVVFHKQYIDIIAHGMKIYKKFFEKQEQRYCPEHEDQAVARNGLRTSGSAMSLATL